MLNKKLTAFAHCFCMVEVYVCMRVTSLCYMHVFADRCTLSLFSVDAFGVAIFSFIHLYLVQFTHRKRARKNHIYRIMLDSGYVECKNHITCDDSTSQELDEFSVFSAQNIYKVVVFISYSFVTHPYF